MGSRDPSKHAIPLERVSDESLCRATVTTGLRTTRLFPPVTPSYSSSTVAASASLVAPSDPWLRYMTDPVAFFRQVLLWEPWSKQIEIAEAVRDALLGAFPAKKQSHACSRPLAVPAERVAPSEARGRLTRGVW